MGATTLDSQYQQFREQLLRATLPHVAFDGWSARTLALGAADAGHPAALAAQAFPGGALEVIQFWSDLDDRRMLDAMAGPEATGLRFRERMIRAVQTRIAINDPWREAVRRTLSFLALPPNAPAGARCTYATVNAIWYAVGDASTDFSYYTKRATLMPIYAATVLYWLDDDSEGRAETWRFLERRIDGTMAIPRLQAKARDTLQRLSSPFAAPPWRRRGTGVGG
ncbi:MAG: COQ9 family protein [Rhodospirillales bacterium]|nr:MAG: COQ9 family protein [Rhodospirillales bacterium]